MKRGKCKSTVREACHYLKVSTIVYLYLALIWPIMIQGTPNRHKSTVQLTPNRLILEVPWLSWLSWLSWPTDQPQVGWHWTNTHNLGGRRSMITTSLTNMFTFKTSWR